MARGFFVAGTDTGVGKTWVSVGLLAALATQGVRAAGMKPIACGCETTAAGLRNEDAELLARYSSVTLPYELVNPYAFSPSIAPHIAAAEAGVDIDIERIVTAFRAVQARCDVVVVEGVGGWMVPLGTSRTTADLAYRLALPVIMVVAIRLGCLSHALLTEESIVRRGLPLAGWVANALDSANPRIEQNITALRQRLPAPLLGVIPPLPALDAAGLGASLSVAALLGG